MTGVVVMTSVVAMTHMVVMAMTVPAARGFSLTRVEAQALVLDLEEVDQLGHVLIRELQIWHPDLVVTLVEFDRGRVPGIDHRARIG